MKCCNYRQEAQLSQIKGIMPLWNIIGQLVPEISQKVENKRSKNVDKRPSHRQKNLHQSQDRGKAVDNECGTRNSFIHSFIHLFQTTIEGP